MVSDFVVRAGESILCTPRRRCRVMNYENDSNILFYFQVSRTLIARTLVTILVSTGTKINFKVKKVKQTQEFPSALEASKTTVYELGLRDQGG